MGILPSLLQEKVYVGASAGSILITPTFGEEDDATDPPSAGSDRALGLVNFTLRPHLGAQYAPNATLASMEKWAARVDVPVYAIDDQTAIKVIDGVVEAVSEGRWKRFTP